MKHLKRSIPFFLLIGGLITFFACSKNKDTPPSGELPADKVVTASIRGRVLDENGLPVAGAAVSGGGANTVTDVNGSFSFKDIQTSSRWGFVKVSKIGYFTGSRTVVTDAGGLNVVTISLIPRTARGSVSGSSGGKVTIQTGDTVAFDAAAVVNAATNAAYTGSVQVFASYLDPTSANVSQIMPGDLRGIGSNGKETALQSFGMMAVELQGDAGEKLQIASGKKATLTMAIPADLQATAPATIPLWYFNETTGQWIEEGSATRQGNSYVGQVGHFTYWNCDAPSGAVSFKVKLKDQHGNAMANTHIQFTSPSFGARGGYTDSTGYAQGMIPKGQTLLFEVLSPCNTVLLAENVGPTLADQDLGTLTVTRPDADLQLSGTVVDCSGNAVANGFVNAVIEGQYFSAPVSNGHFALTISRCSASSAELKLTAGDNATAQQGTASTFTVTKGSKDVGELVACGVKMEEHVSFIINGTTYEFVAGEDTVMTYKTSDLFMIEGERKSFAGAYCAIWIRDFERTGDYPAHQMELGTGTGSADAKDTAYYSSSRTPITLTVTTYGAIGEYIEGRFSGVMYPSSGSDPIPASGTFRVKRKF